MPDILTSLAKTQPRLLLHALAYNLDKFMRTLTIPKTAAVVADQLAREAHQDRHEGGHLVPYVIFQLPEVGVSRQMFTNIRR